MSNSIEQNQFSCDIDPSDPTKILCYVKGKIFVFSIPNIAEFSHCKRPLNAFMQFRCCVQSAIKDQGLKVPEISKNASNLWKVAPATIKDTFEDLCASVRVSWNIIRFVEEKRIKKQKIDPNEIPDNSTKSDSIEPIEIPGHSTKSDNIEPIEIPGHSTKNDNIVNLNEDSRCYDMSSELAHSNSSDGSSIHGPASLSEPMPNSMLSDDQYSAIKTLSFPLYSMSLFPDTSLQLSSNLYNSNGGSFILGSEPTVNYNVPDDQYPAINTQRFYSSPPIDSTPFASTPQQPSNNHFANETTHAKLPFKPDRRQDKKKEETDYVHRLTKAPSSL
ncbi:13508_t:CDS:2, partial [Ambispora gerdemannii]